MRRKKKALWSCYIVDHQWFLTHFIWLKTCHSVVFGENYWFDGVSWLPSKIDASVWRPMLVLLIKFFERELTAPQGEARQVLRITRNWVMPSWNPPRKEKKKKKKKIIINNKCTQFLTTFTPSWKTVAYKQLEFTALTMCATPSWTYSKCVYKLLNPPPVV